MTKTNVKMEQFIHNLVRNFFAVPAGKEFVEYGEGKIRLLNNNTLEFLMAEHENIQVIHSIPFSDFVKRVVPAPGVMTIESEFEQLRAYFIEETHYGTPYFKFFQKVFYEILMTLDRNLPATTEQNATKEVNDAVVKYLTNNPCKKIKNIDSLYKDYYEQSETLYSENQSIVYEWDDMDYVEAVLNNCSSFINLLLMFKELDMDVVLNSEFKNIENGLKRKHIIQVNVELPSGNKLVFEKDELEVKKANYHDILLIISDELSLEKVLKNIKLKSSESDKLTFADLSKDFVFIQDLNQKIEKLLGL